MTQATYKHLQEMARFRSHSQALLSQVFSPLLLLIFVFIIHPSYGGEPFRGRDLVYEVCSRTSDNAFCVSIILPDPRFSGEGETAVGIANTALDLAQIRADEAGNIIANLLNDSFSSVVDAEAPELLERCWIFNDIAVTDLWFARSRFNINTIDAMVKYLNYAANDIKNCQDIIQGTSFQDLAAKNSDIIKLCEICTVSTKFFTTEGAP